MKQFEIRNTITYRWWRDDGKKIVEKHIEALKESGWKRIEECIAEGYVSGELNDCIHMTDEDPDDGVEYTGWWSKEES